jgi:bacterioferritin
MGREINALNFMYNMERFATEIYRTQRRAFTEEEIIDKLNTATKNEQQHADALHRCITELNGTLSRLGALFQRAGGFLGFVTASFGKLFVLKADIWIEKRAIKDYGAFLRKVEVDQRSVALLKKIIADEERHVKTWENCIKILKGVA